MIIIILLKNLETDKITPWEFMNQNNDIVSIEDFRYLLKFPLYLILFPSLKLGCIFFNKFGKGDFIQG